ncbi:O-antigen polysaccharide polymerase Wzy [Mesonia sp.]|uniref:O-antigen polysaccharide polymerase Wzy n=1 Tax=Mesonia sp. TaxID=1960830 RepID=UPI00175F818B|nr:O-antigen polysaccharide polymerase Wzy [Mesonia sp.]HIB36731.1 oligosaccharide repeat unit polymerase [Mesonia sp.]HIO27197.1 oligosaccharide repeat unit polymerase [Flavobacteriaceae bacterium]
MKAKLFLFISYLLLLILLFSTLESSLNVFISFIVNAIVLTLITYYHIFVEKKFSPFLSSFIVFNILFFLVAPIIQINSFSIDNNRFATNFIYREDLVLFTNFLIFLFNISFVTTYLFLKKLKTKKNIYKQGNKKTLRVAIFVILILSIFVFVGSLSFLMAELSRPNWMESTYSVSTLLIWKKVLFLLPFAGIILCVQYFKNKKPGSKKALEILCYLTLFFILLFWFKNPLTEKRNALGPIYISLIFLFIPRLLNTNIKTLSFLFFSMIVLFPLTAVLTHTDASFEEIVNKPSVLLEKNKGGSLTSTFETLNYDAFSNVMATVDYTDHHQLSYGYQSLSAFLFFIPRDIWENKPNTTGKLIGEYLIADYDFKFDNLSNPIVSEGYINFGILGVIIAAIFLACVFKLMDNWLSHEDFLYKVMAFYFAIHLIFLLRGDFTNGFSYYIGTLGGVIVLPKIIQYFIRQAFTKTKRNNEFGENL